MKSALCALVGVLCLVSGCRTVETPAQTKAADVGRPVQPVVKSPTAVPAKPVAATTGQAIKPVTQTVPAVQIKPSAPVIGLQMESVIKSAAGLQAKIFDKDGKQVKELPQQQRGSVSLYNKEGTGQDNYTFDEKGLIVRHLRSDGENFKKGVWEEVK